METGKLQNTGCCAEKVSVFLCHDSRIREITGVCLKVGAWAGLVDKTRKGNIGHFFIEGNEGMEYC